MGTALNRVIVPSTADDLIRTSGDNTAKLLAAAERLAGEGEFDAVMRIVDHVLARDPDNADAVNLAGYACFLHGDLDTALKCFERARQLDPSNLDFGKNYIEACIAANRHQDALSACEELLAAHPDDDELAATKASLTESIAAQAPADEYSGRVSQEINHYAQVQNIHDLPQIFSYWSVNNLRPRLKQVCDADGITDLFARHFADAIAKSPSHAHLVSLGCGDCTQEIAVAKQLVDSGITDFTLECLDVSPVLLERSGAKARETGVEDHITTAVCDMNAWAPERSYAGVMANHSLHHMVELEHIFDNVRDCLQPGGVFVVNDMIGRNGHMRWPEALKLVRAMWKLLPDARKYNHALQRVEEVYQNWDCSQSGFEGIRAQDILPLLVERFHFDRFLAFGNLPDIFVDRCFGHNFSPDNEFDTAFIDFVEMLNGILIDTGYLKPTMMIAVMRAEPCELTCHRHWTPQFCIRPPDG